MRSLTLVPLLVSATLVLAACGDDTAAPRVRVATTVQAAQGDGQNAIAGDKLPLAPTVTVRDADGEPLGGVTVLFAVVEGNGRIQFAADTTDAQGNANAGAWTLGPLPGVNRLQATVAGLPTIEFSATGISPFHITVRYIGTVTPVQEHAVNNAIQRWRSIIVGDLTDIPMNVAAGSCFDKQPAINETVDDVLIYVEFPTIDGAGKVLGQAGPCYIRNTGSLPIIGVLQLDAADLAQMEIAGTIDDVVLHELGHVLGFGTLWSSRGLLVGSGTSNPVFSGLNAYNAFRQLGGTTNGVPVENTGGAGTRDGHWRESIFGDELMTGYVSNPQNPLSAMTVSSLADLGYTTNTNAASEYVPARPLQITQMLNLMAAETLLSPRFTVDKSGKPTKLGSR